VPNGPEIAVFVLLSLPGFIALWLFTALTPTRPQQVTIQLIVVIVLSILSYLIVAMMNVFLPFVPDPTVLLLATSPVDSSAQGKPSLVAVFTRDTLLAVVAASLIAAVLSGVMILCACRELLHRGARGLGLSRKHGYVSHWENPLPPPAP
jgi:predicted CDP-diglyceride synthetase/phosphatidate cytidylyltransferase